jgi:hypothetical protein
VNTSVTMTNHAPAGQAPSFQLGPDGINSQIPGEYVGRVLVWSPRGSLVPGGVVESGLVLREQDLVVMPGTSVTAVFETTIHHAVQGSAFKLVFVPQPRLVPETLVVHVLPPGQKPRFSRTSRATLEKNMALTWTFDGNRG